MLHRKRTRLRPKCARLKSLDPQAGTSKSQKNGFIQNLENPNLSEGWNVEHICRHRDCNPPEKGRRPNILTVYVLGFCIFRERPPGLIQHVLTVLVFWSWVLLLHRLPPSSRSLRLFRWASIWLDARLAICLDLLPAASLPPMQKRDAQHMFLQHRGAHTDICLLRGPAAILFISRDTCSDSIAKISRACF